MNAKFKINDRAELQANIEDNLSFEYLIRNTFDEKLLKTPIEDLNLPTRAFYGLKVAELRTVEDIINFGLQAFQRRKNIGIKTIKDIKTSILKLKETVANEDYTFKEDLGNILLNIPSKYLSTIKIRHGYDDGEKRTYEDVGNKIGVTRERVRQIIGKELRLIKYRKGRKFLERQFNNEVQHLGEQKDYPKCLCQENIFILAF